MSKVYLPTYSASNCIVIKDKDTIRVYDNLPTLDSYEDYTDYFVNSHYLSVRGKELIESVPVCEDQENFTTDYYYRFDISDILIIFIVLAFIIVIMPYKIISRAFGRWLKV